MAKPIDDDYDDDADLDEHEWPDESDAEGIASVDTDPCPFCGKAVYEKADVCPYCHNFISFEETHRRYPIWVMIGAVLAMLGVLAWVLS